MSYCKFVASEKSNELHNRYHTSEYGFPVQDDNEYFERLSLEINQAGLSWGTILKKRKGFQVAFDGFDIKRVAHYDDAKKKELLENKAIIRNKLKVNAVIYNAGQFLNIIEEYGSFNRWLEHHNPKSLEEWVNLFKTKFKFVGGEIVREFLTSVGYLEPAHDKNCPTFNDIIKLKPKWNE